MTQSANIGGDVHCNLNLKGILRDRNGGVSDQRYLSARLIDCLVSLVLLTSMESARAHFEGGRISIGRSSVSIEQPDDAEASQFLFSATGGVKEFLERLSEVPSQAASTHSVLYIGKEDRIHKFLVSSRKLAPKSINEDITIAASTSLEFSTALCDVTSLCSPVTPHPNSAAAQTPVVRKQLTIVPSGHQGPIKLELGEFPTNRKVLQLERRSLPSSKSGAAAPLEQNSIGALIERLSNERRARDEIEHAMPPSPRSGAAAVSGNTAPKLLAVHCTDFETSLPAARKWVSRLQADQVRNKSHGVILTDGSYLPIWPFNERRVWATKTETCGDTRQKSMGSIINIELHYFCSYQGRDTQIHSRATDEQYSTLAKIVKELVDNYGQLRVVSHKEIDRGLRGGHIDPLGFKFARLAQELDSETRSKVKVISDERQPLKTGGEWSHYWAPQFTGVPKKETIRPDDCKRDHRH